MDRRPDRTRHQCPAVGRVLDTALVALLKESPPLSDPRQSHHGFGAALPSPPLAFAAPGQSPLLCLAVSLHWAHSHLHVKQICMFRNFMEACRDSFWKSGSSPGVYTGRMLLQTDVFASPRFTVGQRVIPGEERCCVTVTTTHRLGQGRVY